MTNLPTRETLAAPSGPRIPVLKRQTIGATFTGCIIDTRWRNQQRRNPVTNALEDVLKADGKPRQELVLTLLTIASTMPAGIGDDAPAVPAPGTIVRDILKGGACSQWIDAGKAIAGGPARFDIYTTTTTYAQVYDQNGGASGPKITTNDQLNAVPRGRTVGVYGELTVAMYGPEHAAWVQLAQQAHLAATREPLAGASAAPAPAGEEPW